MNIAQKLEEMYNRLFARFGNQGWWPGENPFEIMVGAILTQNTNWRNVEKAIDNLNRAGVLSLEILSELPQPLLAEYIRPAGYYNLKAGRLKNFFALLKGEWSCDLQGFLQQPPDLLREQLLSVKGIGPETADSIILYAAEQPVFVVDAYTHRILIRHNIIDDSYDYHAIQELFMDNLAEKTSLYNEYHALIVRVGKEFCKKSKPVCHDCPLSGLNDIFTCPAV
jgi:endonuclease-3 related protein